MFEKLTACYINYGKTYSHLLENSDLNCEEIGVHTHKNIKPAMGRYRVRQMVN